MRPGIYFLFGGDAETGQPAVYVGESQDVENRLRNHDLEKDFWNEVVLFTSKDDNLTKTQVGFLESVFIERIDSAERYETQNSQKPSPPPISRPDKAAMEEFLELASILLGALGHPVLDPILPDQDDSDPPAADGAGKKAVELTLGVGDLNATAVLTDDGIVVRQDSEVSGTAADSLSKGYRGKREELEQTGVIEFLGGETGRFTQDMLFPSPSQAAAVIVGYMINGREAWKLLSGETLKSFEETSSGVDV